MRIKTGAVAREAAWLLYSGTVEEYKDAKIAAAKSLRTSVLPSNCEIALELDRLAEQIEGEERDRILLRLREGALQLMTHLAAFRPCLIGSVWRGTARRGSDIDIQVYSSSIEEVLERLHERFQVIKSEWTEKTAEGETARFYHIFVLLPTEDEAEVAVRSPEDVEERRTDAVYGDEIVGLSLGELEAVLRSSPLRRFVPERKKGRRAKR